MVLLSYTLNFWDGDKIRMELMGHLVNIRIFSGESGVGWGMLPSKVGNHHGVL